MRRANRRLLPAPSLFAAFVVAAAAAGCGGHAAAPETPASAPEGVYEIRGTVVAVDAPRLIVEINLEAIPGLMPAMSMPYEVLDASVLAGLSAGDRVRGTLRVDRRGYVITSLQKI
jgi:protein SCO1